MQVFDQVISVPEDPNSSFYYPCKPEEHSPLDYGLYKQVQPLRVWFFSHFSPVIGYGFGTLVLNEVCFFLE